MKNHAYNLFLQVSLLHLPEFLSVGSASSVTLGVNSPISDWSAYSGKNSFECVVCLLTLRIVLAFSPLFHSPFYFQSHLIFSPIRDIDLRLRSVSLSPPLSFHASLCLSLYRFCFCTFYLFSLAILHVLSSIFYFFGSVCWVEVARDI